nr:uncharacterized protein LOC113803934 [Penaeus vannamei]
MRALLVLLVVLAALALGTHASPGFMGMGGKGDYDYYDEGETVIYVPVQYPVHHYSQSSSYGGGFRSWGRRWRVCHDGRLREIDHHHCQRILHLRFVMFWVIFLCCISAFLQRPEERI